MNSSTEKSLQRCKRQKCRPKSGAESTIRTVRSNRILTLDVDTQVGAGHFYLTRRSSGALFSLLLSALTPADRPLSSVSGRSIYTHVNGMVL